MGGVDLLQQSFFFRPPAVYNEDQHVWYSMSHGQLDVTGAYPGYSKAEGIANFLGSEQIDSDPNTIGEVTIPHGLGQTPTIINVQPIEPPGQDDMGEPLSIGDIWYYGDNTNIYVGNTGNAVCKFRWTALVM